MLVDTPGIESEALVMDQFVEDYLANCVGFIYVLHDSIHVHRVGYCRDYVNLLIITIVFVY